jgi:formylglycine-generating enzyme
MPVAEIERLRRGSTERFAEHVEPNMRYIDPAIFHMGSRCDDTAAYCGESPQHLVSLSPYAICAVPVTNELYGRFVPTRLKGLSREEFRLPVVDVTWHDAWRFSTWMDCRLPTEAEWEFACGAGSSAQWCCEDERDLGRFAWYSQNGAGQVREVGTREPNANGVHDLHGNVWEWCYDAYDEDWYARSPVHDPVNRRPSSGSVTATELHRVCRGGSVHALAEMCRTRYRIHEPPDYWAGDLGFRLARSCDPDRAGLGR